MKQQRSQSEKQPWRAIVPETFRIVLAVCVGLLTLAATVGCGNEPVAEPTVEATPRPRAQFLPADTPDAAKERVPGVVADNANLRSGPGTEHEIVGSAAPGDAVEIVARNTAGDWYQLASGAWIAAFLVDRAPNGLPVSSKVLETP